MRALLILYLTHQLGLMTATRSASSAPTPLWFTLLFLAALACRPPAWQPRGGYHRHIDDAGSCGIGLRILIQR